jgi:hypothetical protein
VEDLCELLSLARMASELKFFDCIYCKTVLETRSRV